MHQVKENRAKPKSAQKTIHLSTDLIEQLEQTAALCQISFSRVVSNIIEYHLREEDEG